jgi:hypothetical protein
MEDVFLLLLIRQHSFIGTRIEFTSPTFNKGIFSMTFFTKFFSRNYFHGFFTRNRLSKILKVLTKKISWKNPLFERRWCEFDSSANKSCLINKSKKKSSTNHMITHFMNYKASRKRELFWALFLRDFWRQGRVGGLCRGGKGGRAEGARGLCRRERKEGRVMGEGVILLFWSIVTTDQDYWVVLGAKRVVL